MDPLTAFGVWMSNTSLLMIAFVLFAMSGGAFLLGLYMRRRSTREVQEGDSLLMSSVLGLLALLLSFTFALASDRFDARRLLVQHEANAIGALYLRAQLLEEPYRTRIRHAVATYTANRITLAKAGPQRRPSLLIENDRLLRQVWSESAAAFGSIRGIDFSSTFYDSVNDVIAMDGMRKSARRAHVPPVIFVVLFLYVASSAAMLGFFARTKRGLLQSGFFLLLLQVFLLAIVDIDQPTLGSIRESQEPMENMRTTLQME